jgi:hypothetical protein
MLIEISEQTKKGFEQACEKLGLPNQLPDNSFMRPDLALWNTGVYMLGVITEAENDGVINDITNHEVLKYEPWFVADHGYVPGESDPSGFRLDGAHYDSAASDVGARLTSTSREKCKELASKYPDLYQIVYLNIR